MSGFRLFRLSLLCSLWLLPVPVLAESQEPVACFLYLEPGQTRLEILAEIQDLRALGQLELGSVPVLSTEKQKAVSQQAGSIVARRCQMELNDTPLKLKLESVAFVRRTLNSADVIDPPEPMPLKEAVLGAILVGPALTEAGELKVRCQLFRSSMKEIPLTVRQGEQTQQMLLRPNVEALIAVEKPPEGQVIEPVSAPEGVARGVVLLIAFGALALGGLLMFRGGTQSKVFVVGAILWLLAGIGTLKWGLGSQESISKARLQSLLENIYEAFEAPTEETVYDRLAISVDGELLSEVYLQTRKGLEAEAGVQVDVERVEVKSATVTSADWWGKSVQVKAFWEVSGRVGHWGHEHQRTNWYNANMKLDSVDGNWKLTELEVLDEIRM